MRSWTTSVYSRMEMTGLAELIKAHADEIKIEVMADHISIGAMSGLPKSGTLTAKM